MIKNSYIAICLFVLNVIHLQSQDFNVTFNKPGESNHVIMRVFSDSSLLSLTSNSYLSQVTNHYDSTEMLLVRYNKKGDVMYMKVLESKAYSIMPVDIVINQDKVFLSGLIDYPNKHVDFGFLMRLDPCLEIEKFIVYKYKDINEHGFNRITNYSDSELLAVGNHFILSNSIYSTLFLMDFDFNIKWHSSFLGDRYDISVTPDHIHLWGQGYYPRSDDLSIVERKFSHVICNKNGKIVFERVENEHVNDSLSAGWGFVQPESSTFLLGGYSKITNKYTNELVKIRPNGDIVKKVMLNNPQSDEFITTIVRINDNAYIAIGLTQINFDRMTCKAYLLDSNLNVRRKKVMLSDYTYVGLFESIVLNQGALLYGDKYDFRDVIPHKAVMILIDTFLNMTQKPSILNYKDSLCGLPVTKYIDLMAPDTVWLESLYLRKNLFLDIRAINVQKTSVNVFPNPSKGSIHLGFNSIETGRVIVYNCLGQIIYSTNFNQEESVNLNLPSGTNGLVFIHIRTSGLNIVEKATIVSDD